MTLLLLSFIAGVLTAAAPCILPLLPVIIGGTLVTDTPKQRAWYRPLIIASSLALSVILFTLLLKATTALLGIPPMVWNIVSGILIIALGFNLFFPLLWDRLMLLLRFNITSNRLLSKSEAHNGIGRDILVGAALGPVFSSCSPTYALIVAVVLPVSFTTGLAYLVAYALGLASVLLLIAVAGQAATRKLGWLSDPSGWFRRSLGILFIAVGVAVIFGWDRDLQAFVLEQGWYDPISNLEHYLMRR